MHAVAWIVMSLMDLIRMLRLQHDAAWQIAMMWLLRTLIALGTKRWQTPDDTR